MNKREYGDEIDDWIGWDRRAIGLFGCSLFQNNLGIRSLVGNNLNQLLRMLRLVGLGREEKRREEKRREEKRREEKRREIQ